jgi:hypothetical protein
MSSAHDLPMTLFTLHGLAVSLRDRADTVTERSEAILVTSERLLTQQMKGEPIDVGELLALSELLARSCTARPSSATASGAAPGPSRSSAGRSCACPSSWPRSAS